MKSSLADILKEGREFCQRRVQERGREGEGVKVRGGRRELEGGGRLDLFERASGLIWTSGPVVRCRDWLIIIFSAHPDPKQGL